MQGIESLKQEACGDITYHLLKGDPAVCKQIESSNEFEIQYEGDNFEGIFELFFEIRFTRKADYGELTVSYSYKVLVDVLGCEVEKFETETSFNPIKVVQIIPSFYIVDLPNYKPEPACAKTNADLIYQFWAGVDPKGEKLESIPDWISFDEPKR